MLKPSSRLSMPSKNQKKRSGETTRQRILQAAVTRFVRTSYEEVGLRDIAQEVGVDVAYVHRCFGSKEQLFVEVLRENAFSIEQILNAGQDDLVRVCTDEVFDHDSVSLRILVCSLSSSQARDVLRAYASNDFIAPLAAKVSEPARLRACLLAACLTGIGVLREVLCLQPLHKASREEVQPLVEAIFRACLDDNIALVQQTKKSVSKSRTKQVGGSSLNGARNARIKSGSARIPN